MIKFLIFIIFTCLSLFTQAATDDFSKGPVFANYGENAAVENALADPKSQYFKVLFDVSGAADEGQLNSHFNTVARFINMHVRAGVPKENIDIAMVVHGKAGLDLLSKTAYQARFGAANPSGELVGLLLQENVQIVICGQSASYMDIQKTDLTGGVRMALSAMTANALLQQQGYTLNPF